MIQSGDIGFSNNKKGLFAKLIRFFTRSHISHAFIITRSFGEELCVEEASELVALVPFSHYREHAAKGTEQYWVYRINDGVPPEQVTAALDYCFKEYAGVTYGYLAIPWFVWRWFAEWLGIDVSGEHNWWTRNIICAELQWDYYKARGGAIFTLFNHFYQDTVQAEDLRKVVAAHPDIFELVESGG